MWIKYQIYRSDWSYKFRQGSTRSLISFGSHLDNEGVTILSMTPYLSYILVNLHWKLFEFSSIGSFLECLWHRQKVVCHISRVYISWRSPHPAESSTTSCRLFQGPQNHWMRTISHTTTCPAIHMHLICQFACIQSTFHSAKRSQSMPKVPKWRWLAPSWDVVDDRSLHQLVHSVRQTHPVSQSLSHGVWYQIKHPIRHSPSEVTHSPFSAKHCPIRHSPRHALTHPARYSQTPSHVQSAHQTLPSKTPMHTETYQSDIYSPSQTLTQSGIHSLTQ